MADTDSMKERKFAWLMLSRMIKSKFFCFFLVDAVEHEYMQVYMADTDRYRCKKVCITNTAKYE